jgi:hypothetical protein
MHLLSGAMNSLKEKQSNLDTCPPDECLFPDIGCGSGKTCVDICCELISTVLRIVIMNAM